MREEVSIGLSKLPNPVFFLFTTQLGEKFLGKYFPSAASYGIYGIYIWEKGLHLRLQTAWPGWCFQMPPSYSKMNYTAPLRPTSPKINKLGNDQKRQKNDPCLRKMFILPTITKKTKHNIKETESHFPLEFIASLFEHSIIPRHPGSIKDWFMPEKSMQSDFS